MAATGFDSTKSAIKGPGWAQSPGGTGIAQAMAPAPAASWVPNMAPSIQGNTYTPPTLAQSAIPQGYTPPPTQSYQVDLSGGRSLPASVLAANQAQQLNIVAPPVLKETATGGGVASNWNGYTPPASAAAKFAELYPGYAQVTPDVQRVDSASGIAPESRYVLNSGITNVPLYGDIAPVGLFGRAGEKPLSIGQGLLQNIAPAAAIMLGPLVSAGLAGAGPWAGLGGEAGGAIAGGGGANALIGGGTDALTTGAAGGGVGLQVPMSAVDAALGQGIPSLGAGAVPSTVGLGSPTLGAFGAGPGLQIGTATLDSLVSGALPGIIGGFPDLGAVYSGVPGVVTGNTGAGILSVGGQAPSTFGSDFLNELLRNPIGNFAPDMAPVVTPSSFTPGGIADALASAAEPYGTTLGMQAYPETTLGASGSGIDAAGPGLKLSTLPGTTSFGGPALGTASASLPFVAPQGNWLQRAFGSLYNDPGGTLFNKLDDPETLLRLLGLGGSLASSIMGSNAIKDAAKNAAAAADPYAAQRPAQAGAFNQTLAAGPGAGRAAELTANPNLITQLPNYQWNLDQGLDAINRKAAATGNLESGNRLLALQKYAQGYAADQYGAEFGRRAQLDDQAYRDWLAKLNATGQASGAYNNPATAAGISASGNNAAIQTMYGGINDVLDQVFNPRVRNQQSLQDELLRQLRAGNTLW